MLVFTAVAHESSSWYRHWLRTVSKARGREDEPLGGIHRMADGRYVAKGFVFVLWSARL